MIIDNYWQIRILDGESLWSLRLDRTTYSKRTALNWSSIGRSPLFFYSYRVEFIFAAVFAVLPSVLLLLLAGSPERRRPIWVIRTAAAVFLLFFLQVFIYESIPKLLLVAWFAVPNLTVYVCLLVTPWIIRANSSMKWTWSIAWFLLLIIPGGFWTAELLGKSILWLSRT